MSFQTVLKGAQCDRGALIEIKDFSIPAVSYAHLYERPVRAGTKFYGSFMQERRNSSRNLMRVRLFIDAREAGGAVKHVRTISEAGTDSVPAKRLGGLDFVDQPLIAVLYMISVALVEFFGPMFWAALIVLFIPAEFLSHSH
jgi:hypothetical protein